MNLMSSFSGEDIRSGINTSSSPVAHHLGLDNSVHKIVMVVIPTEHFWTPYNNYHNAL